MFLRVGTQFLQWSIQQGSIRSRNGSGRGAIVGQAIGRNTGATLIGAAVGTMVGYIVGNEMDKMAAGNSVWCMNGESRESPLPGETLTADICIV